jgi:hypothetical protein
MSARTVVAVMALVFVGMALLLEHLPLRESSAVAGVLRHEVVHLVAHSVLYGALAIALARWLLPPSMFEAPRRTRMLRACAATACFVSIAVAQELTQATQRGRWMNEEEGFDLFVDGVAACAGLIVWTHFERRRRGSVARALGVLLHPALLGPAGVFALTWSATRTTKLSLWWTLCSALAVAPVAALWLLGLRRGWFSDHDLSVRQERPAFFGAALVTALCFAGAVYLSHAPMVVCVFALAGSIASVLFAVVTVAGLKVSGHAAVPVGVVALLEATSHRGLWPFAVAACAVSWARITEGRHTPREVAAGWSIAGMSALLARQVNGV